jgi:hypothetical protein
MPISSSYNYVATRADVITSALRKIGALGDWESPTTEQTTVATAALQNLVKAEQAQGMPVWNIKTRVIPFSSISTTSGCTIGIGQTIAIAKPLKVIMAYAREDNIDTPLAIYTRQNFYNLTNHSITGNPNVIYYQPERDFGTLYCYPLPDSYTTTNVDCVIHYHAMFSDMDATGDELDFPPEWTESIIYSLAVRLAPEYGLSINERQQLKMEAKEIREQALSFGTEEGSIFLQPG